MDFREKGKLKSRFCGQPLWGAGRRITWGCRRAAFAALTPLSIWGGVRECLVVSRHSPQE